MLRVLPAILVLSALFAGPGEAAPAARLVTMRTGETPRGATRIVFETDRPVEYVAVERPSGDGFDVHLIGVDGSSPPAPLSVRRGVIRRVALHAVSDGVVAQLDGAATRLAARTFTLTNPARVVVDLSPVAGESAPSPAVRPAGPAVVSKESAPAPPAAREPWSAEPEAVTSAGSSAEDPAPAKTVPAGDAAPPDDGFEDLLVWIHALQSSVTALNHADDAAARASSRRRLAYLLVQRGILAEGEKALVAALASDGHDPATAIADSVSLAEIRLQLGDRDGAAEVARNVVARPAAPEDRVRLAAVLLDTGQPTLAASLAQSTLEQLDGAGRARATFLLAKAQWTQGQTVPARDTVRRLTSQASTPPSLLPAAVLLHADCEFALGRAREAETLYLRATDLPLSDADASWVSLQLGNLARRDGRNDEARKRWRETTEHWPDTFYASQAAWFLRVADRMQKLADAGDDRG